MKQIGEKVTFIFFQKNILLPKLYSEKTFLCSSNFMI